jgi:hypothetical protein
MLRGPQQWSGYCGEEKKNLLTLLQNKPQFLGPPARSLVAAVIDLSGFQSFTVLHFFQLFTMFLNVAIS